MNQIKKKITWFILLLCLINSSQSNDTNNCLLSSVNKNVYLEINKCTVVTHNNRNSKIYRCSCKYNYASNLELSNETNVKCIEVRPGMAIKGNNLLYNEWVSREHCFNRCLQTNKLNGDSFDCKSFEHWHSDCSYEYLITGLNSSSVSNSPKHCAEYLTIHSLNHDREKIKSKRKQQKVDLCVLSNQTIETAGNEFTFNYGVTYYEVLCNNNTEIAANQNKKQNRVILDDLETNYKTLNTSKYFDSEDNGLSKEHVANKSMLKHKQKVSVCELCSQSIDKSLFCENHSAFFNGASCQEIGVESKCTQQTMDIYISKEFAIKFEVKISDIYLNDYKNSGDEEDSSICKSSLFNKTHIKFSVPYSECGTKTVKIKSSSEIEYSNHLFVRTEILNQSLDNHLIKFKCKIHETVSAKLVEEENTTSDFQNTNQPTSYVNELQTATVTDTIENTKSSKCLIDTLRIDIRFYTDKNFQNELVHFNSSSYASFSYAQKLYIEVIVVYSEETQHNLDLKNFELTIYNFWLSIGNKNEYFIQNGCPKSDNSIVFYESVIEKKTAIRFSIKSNTLKLHTKYPVTFHSQLDICLENDEKDTQENISIDNYMKLNYCEKISEICKNTKNETNPCSLNLNSEPFHSKENSKHSIEQIKNKTNSQETEIDLEFINKGFKLRSNSYFNQIHIISITICTYLFIFI